LAEGKEDRVIDEVAIAKIIILTTAFSCYVALGHLPRAKRRLRCAVAIVLVLATTASAVAYFNFGRFQGSWGLVHRWEQFHFYMGSKYLTEIGYDNIYRASLVAVAERTHRFPPGRMRDPITFEIVSTQIPADEALAVRARFSPERWKEFQHDLHFFITNGLPGRKVLVDHGNTGSPAWAIFARGFTELFGANRPAVNIYALLDPLLLLVLFVFARRVFDLPTACAAACICLLAPRAYSYLGGSLLRLDWLFAVGMSLCLLQAGRFKCSGGFLGYAVLSKPFCAVIALALGARFVYDAIASRRIERRSADLVITAVLAAVAIALLSSLLFGWEIWPRYIDRIAATLTEGYYDGQFSLRDVVLQFAGGDLSPIPRAIAAATTNASDGVIAWIVRIAVGGALLAASIRKEPVFSYGTGVFLIYVFLVINVYYWQMLALPIFAATAFREKIKTTAYACGIAGILAFQLAWKALGAPFRLEGYIGSYAIASFIAASLLVAFVTALRHRRTSAHSDAPRRSNTTNCSGREDPMSYAP
jgi:hypothetical protein